MLQTDHTLLPVTHTFNPQVEWAIAAFATRLPSCRALAHCGWYSFSMLLRPGGWISLHSWLHTKSLDPRTVAHLSTDGGSSSCHFIVGWQVLLSLPPGKASCPAKRYVPTFSSSFLWGRIWPSLRWPWKAGQLQEARMPGVGPVL